MGNKHIKTLYMMRS